MSVFFVLIEVNRENFKKWEHVSEVVNEEFQILKLKEPTNVFLLYFHNSNKMYRQLQKIKNNPEDEDNFFLSFHIGNTDPTPILREAKEQEIREKLNKDDLDDSMIIAVSLFSIGMNKPVGFSQVREALGIHPIIPKLLAADWFIDIFERRFLDWRAKLRDTYIKSHEENKKLDYIYKKICEERIFSPQEILDQLQQIKNMFPQNPFDLDTITDNDLKKLLELELK